MFPQHNFSNFSAVPSLQSLLLNLYANLQLPDNQFPSFHPNTVMVDYREIQQARNLGHLNRMFQLQTSRDHREIRRLPEYPEIHHSNIPYGIALSQYELFNDFNFATRWEVRQPTFGIPRYRTTEEMTQIRFDFARNGRSTDRMQDHFPPLPRNVNLEPFWTVGDCQRMQSTNGRSQWPRVDLTATNSKQGSEMSNTVSCRHWRTRKIFWYVAPSVVARTQANTKPIRTGQKTHKVTISDVRTVELIMVSTNKTWKIV